MAPAFTPPREIGPYRVHELLGKGGMASVFRGEHTLLERPVAIKFLRRELASSAAAQQRFLREARLVAKLSHPNIVAVFDFGVLDDGTYYQASELIPGTTLAKMLEAGALEPRRAVGFARQIAMGLASAHELGIVHRDIKPSNIMVLADKTDPDGYRLKILDFGIAKSFDLDAGDRVTQVGIRIGTPGYMSPEQCLGNAGIGPASDIYSLGVVLFAMLCGRRPFATEDAQELIDAHLREPPPPPSRFSRCAPWIDRLVLRCLAKSVRDRPQTMSEIVEVIDGELARDAQVAIAPPAAGVEQEHATARLPDEGPRYVRLGFEPAADEEVEAPTSAVTLPLPAPAAPPGRQRSRRAAFVVVGVLATALALAVALWPGAGSSRAPSLPSPPSPQRAQPARSAPPQPVAAATPAPAEPPRAAAPAVEAAPTESAASPPPPAARHRATHVQRARASHPPDAAKPAEPAPYERAVY